MSDPTPRIVVPADVATPPGVIERALEVIEDKLDDHPVKCMTYCYGGSYPIREAAADVVNALRAANLLAASSPEVTAAERDLIEAAREHVARYSPAALNDSFRTLLAAVERLAAARDKETT